MERERNDEISKLRDELAYWKSSVDRRRDELRTHHDHNDHLRGEGHGMKAHYHKLQDELELEKRVNDDLRCQLHHVNDDIDHNSKHVGDKRGKIEHLEHELAKTKDSVSGLNCALDHKTRELHDDTEKIKELECAIAHRSDEVHALRHKIEKECDTANHLSQDKDGFALRNSNLNATVSSLRLKLADRERELCEMRKSLANLNDLYEYKKRRNDCIEHDIDHLNQKVSTLATHNRIVGHDLGHAADREAYRYGTYCKASALRHKQKDYEHAAIHSEHHVNHVRAHSPARSPRRYHHY